MEKQNLPVLKNFLNPENFPLFLIVNFSKSSPPPCTMICLCLAECASSSLVMSNCGSESYISRSHSEVSNREQVGESGSIRYVSMGRNKYMWCAAEALSEASAYGDQSRGARMSKQARAGGAVKRSLWCVPGANGSCEWLRPKETCDTWGIHETSSRSIDWLCHKTLHTW